VRRDRLRHDEKWVLTTNTDHWAKLWSLADGQSREFQHANRVYDAVFDPRNDRFLTVCWDQFAYAWDMNDNTKPVARFRHESRVQSIATDPTGSFVVTGTVSGHVLLWKGDDFQPLGQARGHQAAVRSIAFDQTGKRFVSGSLDNAAIIWRWDGTTLQQIGSPLGHRGPIEKVVFAPDNRRVATASFDETARIWDADSGLPIGPPFVHYAQPSDLADSYRPEPKPVPIPAADFNRSGTLLATAGRDGTTRLWDCQIPPVEGTDEEVMHWVESITGLRIGANETVQPIAK
jgi:WD40 repeat protein